MAAKGGELAPKNERIRLSHLQLATILVNFIQATASSNYENTSKTLPEFFKELDEGLPRVAIKIETLEDLLCSVNLRSEQGLFWSPNENESLDAFLTKLFWHARLTDGSRVALDRDYNVITYAEEAISGKTN